MHRTVRTVAVLVGFLILSSTSGAFAHRLYNGWIDVWTDGRKCVNEKVTTDHGEYGSGFFAVEGNAEKETTTVYGTIACSQAWHRPAGWIRVTLKVRYKPSSTGTISTCKSFGWYYTSTNYYYKSAKFWPLNSTPYCGKGYYRAQSTVQMSLDGTWNAGKYVGGTIENFDWHYLPTDPKPNPF